MGPLMSSRQESESIFRLSEQGTSPRPEDLLQRMGFTNEQRAALGDLLTEANQAAEIRGLERAVQELNRPELVRLAVLGLRALERESQRAVEERGLEGYYLLRARETGVGELVFDAKFGLLASAEGTITLTPMENEVLAHLARQPERPHSSDELVQGIWGNPPYKGSKDLVRVMVRNIRVKLEPDPKNPSFLLTRGRFGYHIAGSVPLGQLENGEAEVLKARLSLPPAERLFDQPSQS